MKTEKEIKERIMKKLEEKANTMPTAVDRAECNAYLEALKWVLE